MIKAGKGDIEGLTRLWYFTVRPFWTSGGSLPPDCQVSLPAILNLLGSVLKDIQEETS